MVWACPRAQWSADVPVSIGTTVVETKKQKLVTGWVCNTLCLSILWKKLCQDVTKSVKWLTKKGVKWLLLETMQVNDGIGAKVKRSQACVPELGGELLGLVGGLVLHLGRSRLKFSYDSVPCPTQGRYLFLSCTKVLCGVALVGLTLPHLLNLGCVTDVEECLLWPFGNHRARVSVVNSSCQCWSEQPANNDLL